MTIDTIKLHSENITNKTMYNNLQSQKEQLLKHLLLDITNDERMLLQSLINALDNIQHYQLLLNLTKNNEQKSQYQEQINLWQNKSKNLQLILAPILLSFNF